MLDGRTFLEDLALVFLVASVATILFQRLRQPVVLGYLVAGVVVGPHTRIPLFADLHRIEQLSELGIILVIFAIGLEFRFSKLRAVLPNSGIAALVQVPAMLWLGYEFGTIAGWTQLESLFLGGMICISSTMIVVRVLASECDDSRVTDNVLGILVVQDIAAIVLIAIFAAVATGAQVPASEVAQIVGELAAFLIVGVVVGVMVVPWLIREAYHRASPEVLLVTAIGICFGMALLAKHLGFSVALGAFIAGSVIAESGRRMQVELLVVPLRDLFAAVFFVSIGMLVDPEAIADLWIEIVALSATVIIGQIVFGSLGSLLSGRSVGVSIRSGMVLAQIGEFAFVIAGIGVASGTVAPRLMAIAVGVAVVTTFLTPLLVRASVRTADAVERRLPHPVQTFIALYATWLESLRSSGEHPRENSARPDSFWLVIDTILIGGIAVGFGLGRGWLAGRLMFQTGLERGPASIIVAGAGIVLALPFVVGLARHVRRLGALLAARVFPSTTAAVDLADAPRRAMVVGLELLVSSLVVVPLIAVTAPFLPLYASAIVLALVLLALGALFWRTATNLQGHVHAGAVLMLELIDKQRRSDDDITDAPVLAEVLPGLGPLLPIRIAPDSPVVDCTLADLNLRARTGATVLALTRADGSGVGVPSGQDRISAGDVLTVSGTEVAIERARRVLAGEPIHGKPVAEPDVEPDVKPVVEPVHEPDADPDHEPDAEPGHPADESQG